MELSARITLASRFCDFWIEEHDEGELPRTQDVYDYLYANYPSFATMKNAEDVRQEYRLIMGMIP